MNIAMIVFYSVIVLVALLHFYKIRMALFKTLRVSFLQARNSPEFGYVFNKYGVTYLFTVISAFLGACIVSASAFKLLDLFSIATWLNMTIIGLLSIYYAVELIVYCTACFVLMRIKT